MISWHCIQIDGYYSIRAEKYTKEGRCACERLIGILEWKYLQCQRNVLESIIYTITRTIDEVSK
jgi:hypothetical protein